MDRDATCFRHPEREAAGVCVRCDRTACIEDLVRAPVGYQCSDCVRGGPEVRRLGDPAPTPAVTRTLVVAIVAVGLLTSFGAVGIRAFALVPLLVGSGEPWRLVTSAFLHGGFLHLAFNALLLWQLGRALEPSVGPRGMLGLAAAGMAGGGLGVVLLSWLTVATPLARLPLLGWTLATGPTTATVGASGAVFGLMGAVLGLHRRRGLDPRSTVVGSQVTSLVAINLVLTFAIPAISVGGHLGGLAAGFVAALLLPADRGGRRGTSAGRAGRVGRADRGGVGPLLLAGALLVAATAVAGDLALRLGR